MRAPKPPPPLELDASEVPALLERARQGLAEEDYHKIEAIVSTLVYITGLVARKTASIRRLAKLLFGVRTEKARTLLPPAEPAPRPPAPGEDGAPPRPKRKGHGRNGAQDYPGATILSVAHPCLRPGDVCPEDCPGKLYRLSEPARLVRFRGQSPLQATIWECERLRCTVCGTVFTAPAPEGVGETKYDASAASVLAVLKYGTGLPLHRLARLQESLGVPLPASTQWGILHDHAARLAPALEELLRQAAQGELFHNDDTPMKILAFLGERARKGHPGLADAEVGSEKTRAVFTSGILSVRDGGKIAIFRTGPRHAGENLADVLARRDGGLPAPIQMSDALSRNTPKTLPPALQTLLAHCLAHGRRQFVDGLAHFPDACRFVIERLAEVYHNDAKAKELAMGPAERLSFHQAHSGPVMETLYGWLTEQRDQKKVEPNSGLGQAIGYMLRHWQKLTLFLRVPGAPLDNNLCERALKKAILHRKNSLFFKTPHGAEVGDLYMSLIHTCELNGVNPVTYLTELLQHTEALRNAPADWMPWTYADTLQALGVRRAAPP